MFLVALVAGLIVADGVQGEGGYTARLHGIGFDRGLDFFHRCGLWLKGSAYRSRRERRYLVSLAAPVSVFSAKAAVAGGRA